MKIAAGSLQEQASNLSQVVSVFKLDNNPLNYVAVPQHTAALKPRPAPKQPPRAAKPAIAAPQRKQLAGAGAPAAGGD